jgi:hypothetical protein
VYVSLSIYNFNLHSSNLESLSSDANLLIFRRANTARGLILKCKPEYPNSGRMVLSFFTDLILNVNFDFHILFSNPFTTFTAFSHHRTHVAPKPLRMFINLRLQPLFLQSAGVIGFNCLILRKLLAHSNQSCAVSALESLRRNTRKVSSNLSKLLISFVG